MSKLSGPIEWMTIRPAVALLLLMLPALTAHYSCSGTPDTPENAVIEYFMSYQLKEDDKAMGRLCEFLLRNSGGEAMRTIHEVAGSANIYGDGLIDQSGKQATVRLGISLPPFPPAARRSIDDYMSGRAGIELQKRHEPWAAHMVKEDGKWKLCGLEPINATGGDRGN